MPFSASPLGATERYIPVGTRQYVWVPTIAVKTAPTLVELNAGTELTAEIPQDGVNGFSTSSDSVDAGDMASRFVGKVPGLINAEDSSLNFYMSDDGDDARSLFVRDLVGFVVIAPEGFTGTGLTMDVFPVKVSSATKTQGGADTAQLQVQFVVTSEPAENVDVPTV